MITSGCTSHSDKINSIENKPNNLNKYQSKIRDIDGNIYKTIKIGSQIWMCENLRVTRYRNGDNIPIINDGDVWSRLEHGALTIINNDTSLITTYGYLYNWFVIEDERQIAPKGWHVATDVDWNQLCKYLDPEVDTTKMGYSGINIGGLLKENTLKYWYQPNIGATNGSGFCALPGSVRAGLSGNFGSVGKFAHFWTSTKVKEEGLLGAYVRSLYFSSSEISKGNGLKQLGASIRCVKDK